MAIDGSALGLGAAFVVTTGGALWKAANLRSEVYAEYHSRLDLAQAALDELASIALRKLAEQVSHTLGDLDRFDPKQALANPSDLRAHIDKAARLLSARSNLHRYFRHMLGIGPILMGLLSVVLAGILGALPYFSGWKRTRSLGYGGMWLAIVGAISASIVTIYYFFLLHKFSGTEIMSAGERV